MEGLEGASILCTGDTVLLYATDDGSRGFVFSKLSSSAHTSLAILPADNPQSPLPYVHYATFKITCASKSSCKGSHSNEPSAEGQLKTSKPVATSGVTQEEERPIVYGEKVELQHTFTEKYLAATARSVSDTENTNLKVQLKRATSSTCHFKVLPRHWTRSIGDEVSFGDEVKFESVEGESLFLHCSHEMFGTKQKVYKDCRELNLSAAGSSFKIILHCQSSDSVETSKTFRAGIPVLLYNYELKSYITASRSFAFKPQETTKVTCHECHACVANLRTECTSADRFWLFERKDDPTSGKPVSWEDSCYIKHLPSQCYLTVVKHNGESKLTLRPKDSGQSTPAEFCLCFIKDSKQSVIKLKSTFFRIKHVQSDRYLYSSKAGQFALERQRSSSSDHCSTDVDLSLQKSSASTFLFDTISFKYLRAFHFVAGIVPALSVFLSEEWPSQPAAVTHQPSVAVTQQLSQPLALYEGPPLNQLAAVTHQPSVAVTQQMSQPLALYEGPPLNQLAAVTHQPSVAVTQQMSQPLALYEGPPLNQLAAVTQQSFLSDPEAAIRMRKRDEIIKALKQLSGYISQSRTPEILKSRQKLLRNLQVLDLLLECLEKECTEDSRSLHEICYDVLKVYLKGNSRKNKQYLLSERFIKTFQNHVHSGLGADEIMLKIAGDNPKVIINPGCLQEGCSELKDLVTHFTEKLSPDVHESTHIYYLKMLSKLCVCSGRPIQSAQTTLQQILTGKEDIKKLLYCTRRTTDQGKEVVLFRKGTTGDFLPIQELHVQDDFSFLESQLMLFVSVCKGNAACVLEIEKYYVPFDDCLCCAQNEAGNNSLYHLPAHLQALYVELLTVMFAENDRAILPLTFVYPEEASDAPVKMLSEAPETDKHKKIREYVTKFISEMDCMHTHIGCKDCGMHTLIVKVLELLYAVLKHGTYSDQDHVACIMPVLLCIVRQSRVPCLEVLRKLPVYLEWKQLANNLNVPQVRIDTIQSSNTNTCAEIPAQKCLEEMFDWWLKNSKDATYQMLVKALNAMEEKDVAEALCTKYGDYKENVREHIQSSMRVIKLLWKHSVYKMVMCFVFDYYKLRRSMDRLQWIPWLLRDASERHQPAANILHIQDGCLAQVYTSDSVRNHLGMLTEDATLLFQDKTTKVEFSDAVFGVLKCKNIELVQPSLQLLNQKYSVQSKFLTDVVKVQLLKEGSEGCGYFKEVQVKLPKLRQYLRFGVMDERVTNNCTDLIDWFNKLCIGGPVHSLSQYPIRQNQKMLQCVGVVDIILNYVLHNPFAKHNVKVLERCFSFLRSLAYRNREVKLQLFRCMDEFLDIDKGVPAMAQMLTEIFTGGPDLCLSVREDQIEKLFLKVTVCEEIRDELLGTLQAIAKVEEFDMPLKRNQQFIIKYFNAVRESDRFCDELLWKKDQTVQVRWRLLTGVDSPELNLLLNVTGLLASCAEGRNAFIESLCQSMYSVEELLKILAADEKTIPIHRKTPFLQFLVWVYMHTVEGVQGDSLKQINGDTMWTYLDHLDKVLSEIGDVLREKPEQEDISLSFTTESRRPSFIDPSESLRPVQTSSLHKLPEGTPYYFMEGVMPMLRSYYRTFFPSMKKHCESAEYNKRATTSARVCSTLLKLMDLKVPISKLLKTRQQQELYKTTVMSILTNEDIWERVTKDEKALPSTLATREVHVFNGFLKRQSSTIQDKSQETSEEADMNKKFQELVANYSHAWYCKSADMTTAETEAPINEPGSEKMPRTERDLVHFNPEFQKHVDIFCIKDGKVEIKDEAEELVNQLSHSFRRSFRKNFRHAHTEIESRDQTALDIKCLQLLRVIIERQIRGIKSALKYTDPAQFTRLFEEKIHPLQITMQRYKTIDNVIPLLAHPNETISRETLELLKVLFTCTNEVVLQGLKPLLENDERMECFAVTTHKRIEQAKLYYAASHSFLHDLELQEKGYKELKKEYDSLVNEGELPIPGTIPDGDQKNSVATVSDGQRKTIEGQVSVTMEPDTSGLTTTSCKQAYDDLADDSKVVIPNTIVADDGGVFSSDTLLANPTVSDGVRKISKEVSEGIEMTPLSDVADRDKGTLAATVLPNTAVSSGLKRTKRQVSMSTEVDVLTFVSDRHTVASDQNSDETDNAPKLKLEIVPPTPVRYPDIYLATTVENLLRSIPDLELDWVRILLPLLRIQHSIHIKLAVEVLGLTCSMNNHEMQNYLRERPDHISPVNVVGEVALFLQSFTGGEKFNFQSVEFGFISLAECECTCSRAAGTQKCKHPECVQKRCKLTWSQEHVELIYTILQSLIKFCVGNHKNKSVIFNRQAIQVVNCVLRKPLPKEIAMPSNDLGLVQLKSSAVNLLHIMLEITSEESKTLVKAITRDLDTEALKTTLMQLYELRCQHSSMSPPQTCLCKFADDENQLTHSLLRTYHVMKMLQPSVDPNPTKVEKHCKEGTSGQDEECPKEVEEACKFCKEHSRCVEVVYRNEQNEEILTRVRFQLYPERVVRKEVLDAAKWDVNRDSPKDKLRDFLQWMWRIKKDMNWQNRVNQNIFGKVLKSLPLARSWLLLFLTLLLNLFVLITFAIPSEQQIGSNSNTTSSGTTTKYTIPDLPDWFRYYLLFFLGIPHLVLSLWMFAEYFMNYKPHFLGWEHYSCLRKYYRWKVQKRVLGRFSFERNNPHVQPKKHLQRHLLNLHSFYLLVFWLSSMVALIYYGYFYCICLLHFVVVSDTLTRVLTAIWKIRGSLLLMAMLGLIVLFIYAVVSFAFLHTSFTTDNDDILYCGNLGECFVSVIRYGLIGGSLGLVIPVTPQEFQSFGLRLLFDITFFVVWMIIGLNIILGLVIESFIALWLQRDNAKKDMRGWCFICNFPSHEFELRAKHPGFDRHVSEDHNMWNYVYLSVYLDCNHPDDHSAVERYVFNEIKHNRIAFFPLYHAMVLKNYPPVPEEELEILHHIEDTLEQGFRQIHSSTTEGPGVTTLPSGNKYKRAVSL